MFGLAFLATIAANTSFETNWLDIAAKKADKETLEWVKQQLHTDQELAKRKQNELDTTSSVHKKCLTTVSEHDSNETKNPSIYVMMSFSVPDQTWISLSKELEKQGGMFVLRGLPNNSFKELSKKIQHLSRLGVHAEVRLDPMLYTTYRIERVPTFLIIDKEKDTFHTLSGNVSLTYALEKMVGKGQ